MGQHHQCVCSFVPPFVLQNLAKNGISGARESVKVAKETRAKRGRTPVSIATFAGVPSTPTGDSEREIWDSGNSWDQRVSLVRSEGAPTTVDDDVSIAYDYSGVVREFYRTILARRSIDNAGLKLITNVHFGASYMNAFWDGDEMTYGDGDGVIFTSFARSLDVSAHELTHGVTQFTANLDYEGQPGALNEHFSDVFGSAITQYHNKQDAGSADWLIGDEIMGPTLFGEALRSMRAPGTAYDNHLMGQDPQPDHMSNYFTGPEDHYGVHINSGIPNKAFYLAATSIGTDKALLIWYQALQKLWPTANFADAVQVLIESARTLVKTKQVPLGSTQVVRSAFKAVGL